MWNWWWWFCFSITSTFFRIIDLVTITCNKISGIDTISIEGSQTTLFEYMFQSDELLFAFAVCSICGFIFTLLFTVIQIVINFSRDKSDETPISIIKKAFKSLFVAALVPFFMYAFFLLGNAFARALYIATNQGQTSISQFMFAIFARDALLDNVNPQVLTDGTIHWWDDSDLLNQYIEIGEFDFIYSYIICAVVVWALFTTVLKLVERVFSLFLLYVIAPVVIASSVMDDGAKFKAWREQVLVKFFSGFGAILGINIYLLVVSLVTRDDVEFFTADEGFYGAFALNAFMKLVIIAGGAVCLKQIQAVVGNVLSPGAGDKMMAEGERANGAFGSLLGAPARAGRSLYNFGRDTGQYGFGTAVASRLGLKNAFDYKRDYALKERNQENAMKASGNYNGNVPNNAINNAVNGQAGGGNNFGGNNNNQNGNNNNNNQRFNDAKTGQNMVDSVIANANNNNMK